MHQSRVFYITDIHGSDLCFRKFLNSLNSAKNPDVIIIGGDITGKWLVPIVRSAGGQSLVSFEGEKHELHGDDEIRAYEKRLADTGAYSIRCDPETAEEIERDESVAERLLQAARVERLQRWIEMADRKIAKSGKRIVINAGNDDPFYIDEVLRGGRVTVPEGRAFQLDDDVWMLSTGFANHTPWPCPRDIDEQTLEQKIDDLVSQVESPAQCIFNFHAPPFGTVLDIVVRLDDELRPQMALGAEEVHVGSVSVRTAIERHQPLVGLHGHIHEHHAYQKLGMFSNIWIPECLGQSWRLQFFNR